MTQLQLIKPGELEVPTGSPYANDLLGREALGKNLTVLVNRCQKPTTIALDAKWGSGKTTFLRMWQQSMRDIGLLFVAINAWSDDWADDPLIPLAVRISEELATKTKKTKVAVQQMLDAVVAAKDAVAPRVADLLLKVASGGLVDREVPKEIAEAIAKSESKMHDATGGHVPDDISRFLAQTSALRSFRNSIEVLRESMPQMNPHPHTPDTESEDIFRWPLLIILDELDRCRPTWSIQTLERIKHLFGVPGVVFVLAVDFDQLAASVKAVYGQQFDGGRYLKRFVDLRISAEPEEPNVTESIDGLFEFLELPEEAAEILSCVVSKHKFGFRDIQQIASRYKLLSLMVQGSGLSRRLRVWEVARSSMVFVILHEQNPELLHKIIDGDAQSEEIIEWFRPPKTAKIPWVWQAEREAGIPPFYRVASLLGDDGFFDRVLASEWTDPDQARREKDNYQPMQQMQLKQLYSLLKFSDAVSV